MSKKQYYCDYGTISSRNGVVYLHCSYINDSCMYQRYCTNDQCIKHTNNFVNCKYRKGIDDMAKKKNSRYKENVKTVNSIVTVANESNKESIGEDIDMRTTKRVKVILVTPDYFIVDNGGRTQRIQGKTELKAGDWYILNLAPEKKIEIVENKIEEKNEEKIEETQEEIKIEEEKIETENE